MGEEYNQSDEVTDFENVQADKLLISMTRIAESLEKVLIVLWVSAILLALTAILILLVVIGQ